MPKRLLVGVQRVMRSMLPPEEDFFVLFQQQADKAVAAAEVLIALSEEFRLDWGVNQIKRIEHEADEVAHDITRKLNTTFVTPILFDREDILHLSDAFDDISDCIKGAIDRLQIFRVTEMTPEAGELAQILVAATKRLRETTRTMQGLRPGENVYCAEINALENEADAVLKRALGRLFEDGSDPVRIIKWKEIYDYIEEATDACEEVVNLIEGMVVKNA